MDLSSKKCKGIAEGIVVKDMHSLADYGLHLVSYLLSIIKGEPFFLMESHDGVLVMCGVTHCGKESALLGFVSLGFPFGYPKIKGIA